MDYEMFGRATEDKGDCFILKYYQQPPFEYNYFVFSFSLLTLGKNMFNVYLDFLSTHNNVIITEDV
jgi:hypothetical protein